MPDNEMSVMFTPSLVADMDKKDRPFSLIYKSFKLKVIWLLGSKDIVAFPIRFEALVSYRMLTLLLASSMFVSKTNEKSKLVILILLPDMPKSATTFIWLVSVKGAATSKLAEMMELFAEFKYIEVNIKSITIAFFIVFPFCVYYANSDINRTQYFVKNNACSH